MDGFNPNFDLSDKFMLNSLNETTVFYLSGIPKIMMPKYPEEKCSKIYNALFNKKEG